MTVTPHIGTSVDVASTVAGGSLVGAAVFLVDRVSDGALDKLGRHQYHLSGPWAEPVIRRGGRSIEAPQATQVGVPQHPLPSSQDDEAENLFLEGD